MGLLSMMLQASLSEQALERRRLHNQGAIAGLLGERPDPLVASMRGSGVAPGDFGMPTTPNVVGSGLLADPMDMARRLEFGAGLMGADPSLAGPGASIFNQAYTDAYRAASQEKDRALTAEIARSRLGQDQAQWEVEEARRQYGANVTQARESREARLAAQLGELNKGYHYAEDPVTGEIVHAAAPGTKPYVDAQAALDASLEGLEQLDDFIVGYEQATPSAPGWSATHKRLRLLAGNIKSTLGTLRNYGAPQGEELRRLDEALPDVTSMGPEALMRSKGTLLAAYRQLQALLERSFENQKMRTRAWRGLGPGSRYYGPRATQLPEDMRSGWVEVPEGTGVGEPVETRPLPRRAPIERAPLPEAMPGMPLRPGLLGE